MKVIDMVFSTKGIIDGEVSMLDDEVAYKSMSKAVNPYGDGQACRRIANVLAGKETDRYEVR